MWKIKYSKSETDRSSMELQFMPRDTREKVCKTCRRFVKGPKCPVCNQSNLTAGWKGVAFISNPADSEIAKTLGITAPGKYCIFVKQ